MPRALWLVLLAICAAHAVFASVVSVGFTAVYGLSRWTLKPDTTAIFPFLVLINLVTWVGYALWMPAIFWLGRRFPFDRHRWKQALLVHVPASVVITSLHLLMVATWRYYLQGVRGGDPVWVTTVLDAFFRTVDQELPVYWALVGLQHALDYSRQAREREVRAARLEARLIESQLQALQQQLHPHFLFNTLHAISTLVHRDPDKADLMIERLSDLLRITLRKVGVQEVELAEELEYVRAYLDIEQVHFGKRLRIEYRLDAAAMDVLVPTLILQPLVENAIRHGLEPMVRPGTLGIEAHAEDDTLRLRILDDGAGFAPNWQRTAGVGLANTRSRLERLYGQHAALTIRDNAGGGVVIDIHIPLRRPSAQLRTGADEAAAEPAAVGMTIRVLVADDQPMARERLVSLLAAEPGVELAGTASSGPETVECIHQVSPNLVFLDLQMPGMDGFKVIEAVGVDRMPPTVFVTAYDEYAVRAFEVQALDYLLKPFGRQRFQSALARARRHLERERHGEMAGRLAELLRTGRAAGASRERLLVKAGGRVSFVDVEQIDWVEAEGNHVRIHAGGQVHLMRETMNGLVASIGVRRFFRIHRSRIVNVARVKELLIAGGGDYQVVLSDGTRLGLSRLYRDALQQQLTSGV